MLGGRGRATNGPYVAHDGPHVLYSDGPDWEWLHSRRLVPEPLTAGRGDSALRFQVAGSIRSLPPLDALRMLVLGRRRKAPVDQDFASWAEGIWGPVAARSMASFMAVVTYDADPGRLSAAFVWDLLLRVSAVPFTVRYVRGGWAALIDRLHQHALALGVRIQTGSRVDRLPESPVIVATQLASARQLLADDSLHWESGRCALLDLGLERRRGDPFLLFDLDRPAVIERFSAPDPSLAPAGHSLIQAQAPIGSGPRSSGIDRLEYLLDLAFPSWRERLRWRREGIANGRSGAIDLPGYTWRDRPAIDRGDGVFLAGDMVAAPGMRGEIAVNSALAAAEAALALERQSRLSRTRRRRSGIDGEAGTG